VNPETVLRVVEKIEPAITKTQNNNNIPPRDGALNPLKVKSLSGHCTHTFILLRG
jgi:hypothetical protein